MTEALHILGRSTISSELQVAAPLFERCSLVDFAFCVSARRVCAWEGGTELPMSR